MATTYMIDFGPLQEVPSDVLKKMQASTLHSRATGADNTLALGLDSPSTNHYSRKVVGSLGLADTGGFVILDALPGFDWRDREIRVLMYFDPTRDIRPGEALDKSFAKIRHEDTFYSSSGNYTKNLPGGVYLQVTGIGGLTINKPSGYLYVLVEGTVQLKERT